MAKSRVPLIIGGFVVVGVLAALGYGYTRYQAQSTAASATPAPAHWTYEGEKVRRIGANSTQPTRYVAMAVPKPPSTS